MSDPGTGDTTALADPIRWAELAGRRVAVWGAGREGMAAVAAVPAAGGTVTAVVVDEATGTWTGPVPRLAGSEGTAALLAADVVIKSPGISPYRADARALREAGVRRTGGTALALAELPTSVAVTGSKGKSTTASLLAHLLGALGHPVTLGGNIGVAPLELLAGHGTPVLELSSFQSAEVRHSPDVGVLTAFFPDHLDWHGSLAAYRADKTNLFRWGPRAVVADATDPAVRDALTGIGPVVWHGLPGGVHADETTVRVGGRALLATADSPLRGRHNVANLCAVLTVLDLLGVGLDGERLAGALRQFRPLPHRLELISTAAGLSWYDDGLATTPQAAMAALDVFGGQPVCLLLGGRDRGLDYAPLGAHLAARAAPTVALLLPDNGERIAAAIDHAGPPAGALQVRSCPDLPAAVAAAAALTPPGGAVLLSPAAPSFGHYTDYTDRGRAFREAVAEL